MGCITSKVMSKSISFKEELNQSLQRRSNSISSIEELIISGNNTDQFLGLLCGVNVVDNKLRSESWASETPESNTNPKPDIVQVSTENIEAWELARNVTSRLVQSSSTSPIMDVDDQPRRSKSCHWFPEYEVFSMDGSGEIKEDGSNASTKLRGRARSIHTVEEYDAILEKLWLSRSQQTGSDDQSTDEASQKEKISAETSVLSSSGLGTTGADPNPTSLSTKDKGEAREQKICEKGLKRKAVAKGLESLSVPQTIEFQNVGSHKDWLQAGSPGAYVTPKFGSYALPSSSSTNENQCSASVAFNPELVAAFEECMQQLQAEEEIVLQQIAQDLEEESNKDIQGPV